MGGRNVKSDDRLRGTSELLRGAKTGEGGGKRSREVRAHARAAQPASAADEAT